jgi:hypothetical protein
LSDAETATLLRSDNPLVVIEAAAGCGKTHQGAAYAKHLSSLETRNRLLILTHTNAACDVFAKRVQGVSGKVDIRTIDGLIAQIAGAYHTPLGFPSDPTRWALREGSSGFDQLAKKVADYLEYHPMISAALARRYPTIVCDEHQDCSLDQHRTVMALHSAGAALRIFGDPLQRIFGKRSDKAIIADWERWEILKRSGSTSVLNTPHRWHTMGEDDLGVWINEAREILKSGGQIDLTQPLPASIQIVRARNLAQARSQYMLGSQNRRSIDTVKNRCRTLLVLAPSNDLVSGLRSFWNRSLPIWEGHQRGALSAYVDALDTCKGNAIQVGVAVIDFLSSVGIGISTKSHGDRLIKEIDEECAKQTKGKPANIQSLARCVLSQPDHHGAAELLVKFKEMIAIKAAGFENAKIDFRYEFHDAIKLKAYECPVEGLEEITRHRTYARLSPPEKAISSIHKAKGLECDHVMVVMNQTEWLSNTLYSRNRLYVALSRARRSLTLVIPEVAETSLFKAV